MAKINKKVWQIILKVNQKSEIMNRKCLSTNKLLKNILPSIFNDIESKYLKPVKANYAN